MEKKLLKTEQKKTENITKLIKIKRNEDKSPVEYCVWASELSAISLISQPNNSKEIYILAFETNYMIQTENWNSRWIFRKNFVNPRRLPRIQKRMIQEPPTNSKESHQVFRLKASETSNFRVEISTWTCNSILPLNCITIVSELNVLQQKINS